MDKELWDFWPKKFDSSIFTIGLDLITNKTFDKDKGGMTAFNCLGYGYSKFFIKPPSPGPISFGAGELTASMIQDAQAECDQCGGMMAAGMTMPNWLIVAIRIAKAILAFLETQMG